MRAHGLRAQRPMPRATPRPANVRSRKAESSQLGGLMTSRPRTASRHNALFSSHNAARIVAVSGRGSDSGADGRATGGRAATGAGAGAGGGGGGIGGAGAGRGGVAARG